MKTIKILTALLFSFFVGSAIGSVADINPLVTGAVGVGLSLIPQAAEAGVLRTGASLHPEVWTGILVKKMRDSAQSLGWIGRMRDMSQFANNNVIHMVDIGADPDVLINNTTYPLAIQNLPDGSVAIKLDKYQTKPTRITDDELHNISYDKKGTTVERHRYKIDETKHAKALHSVAPAENTAKTPVLLTTGAAVDGRKTLVKADIIKLKKAFDDAKFPVTGRVLVLCSDHVNDLLGNDQKFADQYYNFTTGKIANMFGFEIYEYVECPFYHVGTLKKREFADTTVENYRQASVAFHESRVVRVGGTTKAYLQDAASSPTMQENLLSYRHYYVALPTRKEGLGAIVSAKA